MRGERGRVLSAIEYRSSKNSFTFTHQHELKKLTAVEEVLIISGH